jgi:4-amino-4-deoxy-L-arabinose transferase-like glycosyltransferase
VVMQEPTSGTTLAPNARADGWLDVWLDARWKVVLGVILGLAIVLRALLFAELWDGPAFTTHLHDQMDTTFFHQSGVYIANVDPLCKARAIHPQHRWHVAMGEEFFKAHPDQIGGQYTGMTFAALPAEAKAGFVQLLWSKWYGGTRYHQEPFYAYFVAAVYAVFGENVPLMYVFQMFIGVLTIAMVMSMSRQMFGALVGALTGLLIVLWGPQMHFELVMLRTTFLTFFGIALLYATQRFRAACSDGKQVSRGVYIAYGALIGLASATKTTFLLFGVGLVVAALLDRRSNRAALARDISWILGGVLIPLLPIFIRNSIAGAPLFSMTSVGPITFAASNLPGFNTWTGWSIPHPGILSELMFRTNGAFVATVRETLALHDGVSSYLGLLLRKFLSIWHWYEMPNNTNFYYISLHSAIFTATRYLVGAIWVLPMALVGIAASGRRPGVRLWWWYVIFCVGPLVVFYSLSRFRVPLVVGMMPFAAFGLVSLVAWIRRARWVKAGGGLLAFLALVGYMNREMPRPVVTGTDHQNAWTLYYFPKVQSLGNTPAAAAKYDEFLALLPRWVFTIEVGHVPADVYEAEWSQAMARVFKKIAVTYRGAGDAAKAARLAELAATHKAAVVAFDRR